jgi:hypothetical protein
VYLMSDSHYAFADRVHEQRRLASQAVGFDGGFGLVSRRRRGPAEGSSAGSETTRLTH